MNNTIMQTKFIKRRPQYKSEIAIVKMLESETSTYSVYKDATLCSQGGNLGLAVEDFQRECAILAKHGYEEFDND